MSSDDKKTPKHHTADSHVKIEEGRDIGAHYNNYRPDSNRVIRSASTQTVEDALSTIKPPKGGGASKEKKES